MPINSRQPSPSTPRVPGRLRGSLNSPSAACRVNTTVLCVLSRQFVSTTFLIFFEIFRELVRRAGLEPAGLLRPGPGIQKAIWKLFSFLRAPMHSCGGRVLWSMGWVNVTLPWSAMCCVINRLQQFRVSNNGDYVNK